MTWHMNSVPSAWGPVHSRWARCIEGVRKAAAQLLQYSRLPQLVAYRGRPPDWFDSDQQRHITAHRMDNIPTKTVLAHRSSPRDTLFPAPLSPLWGTTRDGAHLWACSAQSHEWGLARRRLAAWLDRKGGVVWCGVPKALLPDGKRPGCLPKGEGKRARLCVLCARGVCVRTSLAERGGVGKKPGWHPRGGRCYSRSPRCTPSLSACWCRRSSCNAHAIVLPGPRRAFSNVARALA